MKQKSKFKKTEIGKIPEDLEECKKNGSFFPFDFKGKTKKIKFIENPAKEFISDGGPHGIRVGKLFFTEFGKKERVAILWHELYHCRITYILGRCWQEIKFLCGNKVAYWEEEYGADEYSATENDTKDCLAYLKICKNIYRKKVIKYNNKLYPPIEKRIKKIENLLNETRNKNQKN